MAKKNNKKVPYLSAVSLALSVRQYVNRPTEGVQGFTRSHWTPPSVEYSGRIAPDGRRVRMPLKKYKKVPYLSAVFLFSRPVAVGAPVRNQAHRPMEGVEGY